MDLQSLVDLSMGSPSLLEWFCSDDVLMQAPLLISGVDDDLLTGLIQYDCGAIHLRPLPPPPPMQELLDEQLFFHQHISPTPVVDSRQFTMVDTSDLFFHQHISPTPVVDSRQFTMVDTSDLFLHQHPADAAVQIGVAPTGTVAPGYEGCCSAGDGANCCSPAGGRASKSSSIGFEDISKHFCMTITDAAKEMKVGLTVLKKRCRELGISRWPHRKMKSLSSLIHNVQELAGAGSGDVTMQSEIESLEENRRLMERMPELELSERTKKLRQACFKANYKRRRALQPPPCLFHPHNALSF